MRTLPLIFAIACWSLPADFQAASAATNIVVIYADDLGYGDIQCYNPQRGKIPTPHVDNLASEGMRFIDAHSSSGVCSPSRYTILTGRYHWRSRLQSGIVGLWGPPLITPDRLTIGGLAKKHGYRTACIGKWHLGWDWSIPAGKEKLFSIPGNFGQNQQNLSARDEHRTAWRELFSKPIAPLGPTNPRRSPRFSCNDTSLNSVRPPKAFSTPANVNIKPRKMRKDGLHRKVKLKAESCCAVRV